MPWARHAREARARADRFEGVQSNLSAHRLLDPKRRDFDQLVMNYGVAGT